MKKTIRVDRDTIKKNRENCDKFGSSSIREDEERVASAVLTGPGATKLLWWLGSDVAKDILSYAKKELDTLPLYGEVEVEGEFDGLKARIVFIKEITNLHPNKVDYKVLFFL